MSWTKKILLVLLVLLVAIQFVPVDRSNPTEVGELWAPGEVESFLRQACYNCHSHETQWPWYSRVAPVSWLISHHVNHGREYLNLSTWNTLEPDQQRQLAQEMVEEMERGAMPPALYRLAHSGSRPTDEDIAQVEQWAAGFQK
ncbi:MAG: heme-binding domain-containing protein [Bradymonadales bacterium]|nr:heme-binding domain-containing protein [Bradymonadales bacterium]